MNTSLINSFLFNMDFLRDKSSQYSLLVMTEKLKESIGKGKAFGALLTDSSKAFDCIDHTFWIAKLIAFGFSPLSLKLIYSYLSNRTQRIEVNENFSNRTDNGFGVLEGSVSGQLLFNIDMIDKILMLQVTLVTQHYVNVQQTYLV